MKRAGSDISLMQGVLGAATKGDLPTRLGFVLMGFGCLAKKQIGKGMLFLFAQASYILYMILFGAAYLRKFLTLGETEQTTVWNETLQINETVKGDNSMLILLFSILTIVATLLFIYLWLHSVALGYKALALSRQGMPLPGFREDLYNLWHDKYHFVLLALPFLGLLAFTVLPLLFMICMAFTNFDVNHQPPGKLFTWTGFETFKEIIWSDPMKSRTFINLLIWTLTWAACATFSCYFGGMLLALLINKKSIKLKGMWRSFFVVSIAIPQFVSLLLMRQLLNDNGTLNVVLQSWGWIQEPIRFLSGDLARVTVLVVNFWIGVPYSMLITSGILLSIPADLYESARIDGAGPFMTFRKITLPYMMFVTAPYLITRFVGDINNFNVIYLLTRGDPKDLSYFQAGKTDLLITWLYKQTVDWQNYNLASAIGIIIFAIVAVLSLVMFNVVASGRREEDFQG